MLATREPIGWKNLKLLTDIFPLNHTGPSGSEFINRQGLDHLNEATRTLLAELRMARKITFNTARKAITSAFFDHLTTARSTGVFLGHVVARAAKLQLSATKPDDGVYVFPVLFAPASKVTSFKAGPVEIVSKSKFEERFLEILQRSKADSASDLVSRWNEYTTGYDHFLLVTMSGFEADLAWEVAREVAEFLLNLVRIVFGYRATSAIKLSGGFMWEIRRSTLRFDTSGAPWPSRHVGPWGSHLEDDWQDHFESETRAFKNTLGTFALKLANGDGLDSPAVERLRYAHRLIAEAYSEPHYPQRLVRFVSALEALSLAGEHDKAHTVSKHCACAGGWGSTSDATEIYDAVRNAYRWRSAVVHGDAPDVANVREDFLRIEKHAYTILIGYMVLFAALDRRKPQSVRALRRDFSSRIDHFFWDPDVALLRP